MAKNNRLHPHECCSAKKDSPPTPRRTSMNSILANKGFFSRDFLKRISLFVLLLFQETSTARVGTKFTRSWMDGRNLDGGAFQSEKLKGDNFLLEGS